MVVTLKGDKIVWSLVANERDQKGWTWMSPSDNDVELEIRPEGIMVSGWYDSVAEIGECLIKWEDIDSLRLKVQLREGSW